MEHLVLHVVLTETAAPDAGHHLMEALLSGTDLGDEAREITARFLDPASEPDAAALCEPDPLGPDTVRAADAIRRIEVVSREYDA
jgi:hypothetical protein